MELLIAILFTILVLAMVMRGKLEAAVVLAIAFTLFVVYIYR